MGMDDVGDGSKVKGAVAVAAAAVMAAVAVAVIVVPRTEHAETVLADNRGGIPATEATTNTTTPPTEVPQPLATTASDPDKAEIVVDPSGRWTLSKVGRCLELVLDEARYDELLCGVEPTDEVMGDLVALDTPLGRMVVAVVDPSVTGFSSYPRAGGGIPHDAAVGRDPDVEGLSYVVGFAALGWADFLIRSNEHTIARVLVPSDNRPYAPEELQRTTTAPYGRWSAYRSAGGTGYFFSGEQHLGFYDGAGGELCVLYRRLGGLEAMLADGCVDDGPDHLPVAALSAIEGSPSWFILLALTDRDDVNLHIELPTGERVKAAVGRYPDPTGSGWTALAQDTDFVDLPPSAKRVSFVLSDRQGTEIARREVDVPGRQ